MAQPHKNNDYAHFNKLEFSDLVDIVRSRGRSNKTKINEAYNEICYRMKPQIKFVVNKFYIPGHTSEDIHQEALFALRYKAIPDYKKHIKGKNGPYPFDKFAILCIRRHLSTLLKTCYQNKQKTLNTSLSLDQDRNDSSSSSSEELFLADIVPSSESSILDDISQKDYHQFLFNKLYSKLSKFEKQIFVLYSHKYSYEEIASLLYRKNERDGVENRDIKDIVKSVDNALSRIKQKAKEVFKKHGDSI